MKRKLYKKNELKLWKEITKDDIKLNDYISEEMSLKIIKCKFEKNSQI